MPRDVIPPKPSGFDPEALFMKAVWEKLWGRSGRVNNSSTVRVSDTANGLFLQSAAGGAGASKLFMYRITTLNNDEDQSDYFMARKWNPAANDGEGDFMGPEERVAKCVTGRGPGDETIDETLISYEYGDGGGEFIDNLRKTIVDGSGSEWHVMHPRYTEMDEEDPSNEYGNVIFVQRIPNGTGVLDENQNQIYLLEIQPNRYWAYQDDQSGTFTPPA